VVDLNRRFGVSRIEHGGRKTLGVPNAWVSSSDLQGLVTSTTTTTQEQIGGVSAPDEDSFRNFAVVLCDFAETRMSFCNAMEACQPLLEPRRECGACDDDVLTKWGVHDKNREPTVFLFTGSH